MTQLQLPFLIIGIPLFTALAITIIGWFSKRWAYPLALLGIGGAFIAALRTFCTVMKTGTLHYFLGSWVPPIGIEYVVDPLNAMMLVIITTVALMAVIYSYEPVKKELSDRTAHYYTLFTLMVTGLLGMTITGDAFNLYVLLEIASIAGYAVLALGKGRSLVATFNYLIMGTIGACFYLLGVGYLLLKTGTLNMLDINQIIVGYHFSQAIFIAFTLIMIGLWIKMALFPLHGWLPNAYTHAPIASSCLVAPLVTKVTVYIMIRMMFTVFGANYVYGFVTWGNVVVGLSTLAIVTGSLYALGQTNVKRMLTYIIIAEVGYMVGGLWLGNSAGVIGGTYHILADAMMTLCLFMAVGAIAFKTGSSDIESFKGKFKEMPFTMTAFVIGAFSMIGIPPTCGFFSKWYLITGAYQAGQWLFMVALLFSSLINAILFFRIIEVAYFRAAPSANFKGHALADEKFKEAPASMVVPLLLVAASLIAIGFFTNEIVTNVVLKVVPQVLM
jgi:multicomponent Na+:H+ antiporter subunit D